ncbi:MAG: O-antigen ligase family protein [Bryobacteraceae bacterium]|nr:O-antigen ligase family protein [Bryobacteraceae bacterium]
MKEPTRSGVQSYRSGPALAPTARLPRTATLPVRAAAPLPGVPAHVLQRFRSDELNSVRNIGLFLGLIFIFLRFGFVHEVLMQWVGINTRVLLIFTVLVVPAVIASGGLGRALQHKPTIVWVLLTIWCLAGVPFSYWPTGSLQMVLGFLQTSLLTMVVLGGFAITLEETYRYYFAIACAALVNILTGKLFAKGEDGERFQLDFGSIGNSNDFAAHLLFVFPFLLFVFLGAKSKVLKGVTLFGIVAAIYIGATTGSRGAMLSLLGLLLFVLIRAPGRIRAMLITLVPITFVVLVLVLPQSLLDRYASTFGSDGAVTEATESGESRKDAFKRGIALTLRNPIFGVGTNGFGEVEGHNSGKWMASHNAYVQVSSETGIPGFLLMIAGIVFTYRLLSSTSRMYQGQPGWKKLHLATFCAQMSLVSFSIAIFFLSMGYTMYLPALAALAVALHRGVRRDLALAADQQTRSPAKA